jgi:hypothetical protein
MLTQAWERALAMVCITVISVAFIVVNPMMLPAHRMVRHGSMTHRVACATSTPNVPDGPDGMGGCFPGASNTGVPSGVTLTTYSGPCTITTNNTTIDAKDMTACEPVSIKANNVTITRSRLVQLFLDVDDPGVGGWSVSISDSEIDRGQDIATAQTNRALGGQNFTVQRVDVQGGYSTAFCWTNCQVSNSYFHNQWQVDPGEGPGNVHASAFRQQDNLALTHNSILCEVTFVPPDNGCSADVSGYPDFGPIHDNSYDNNLFMANIDAGFCIYGGNTGAKPYSSDPANAKNIKIRNNIFQKGASGKCGAFGPVTDYKNTEPTNEFTNNLYDDGASVPDGNF